ncbi:MAG: PKD domain-containing protein [Bacteroidales bacterium]|nr:PKD domain-containing protein [Bacteroidales bacterium]
MKRFLYILLVLPFILYSCEMAPRAYFMAAPGDPVVGEEVLFTNESENAVSFEWDFGDGYVSNEVHPSHIYNSSGSFEVSLTAWTRNGLSDKAYLTIDVKIPTLLEVEVLEYYEQYPVSNASVILYRTLADWDKETNRVIEGYTDKDGFVVFSGLDNIVYYADVWETSHDNYTLRNEDVGFIRTPEIMPNKINRFVAYVDKADHGKGIARRENSYVIRKLVRKADLGIQPETSDLPENWKEMLEKSVRVKR